MRKFWKKQEEERPRRVIERPRVAKKTGCKVKFRKKQDGYDISFSSECRPEERAEILRQFNENRGE